MNENKIKQMKRLIVELNAASNAYYNTGDTIMSDKEFDRKVELLKRLEDETGVVLSNSPVHNVGAVVLDKLNKIKHEHKAMLSLGKVHHANEIVKFAESKSLVGMIKCDGLSIRLTYEDGKLIRGETRGNGIDGSEVTMHVKQFENIPLSIDKEGLYVVDGEAIITEKDFATINDALPEGVEKFKNSRNLASGTLSLLDTSLVKERKLRFVLWDVIKGESKASFIGCLSAAETLGFTVVPYQLVEDTLNEDLIDFYNSRILDRAKELGYPCDGVVWKFDDIAYGDSRGQTSHHFCNAVAYKFQDETYETILRDVEWSMGKRGILTPVAVFDPVEIEGTEVSRASVHNVSILTELDLRPGDTITVYKANMIIPQVAQNLSTEGYRDGYIQLPGECPVCGGKVEIQKDNETNVLVCMNDNCQGKLLGRLSHAVSKNALNIEGLSEATLEYLVDKGWVTCLKDLFKLHLHKSEWEQLSGFGKKSVEKLLNEIELKRNTTFERFLYAQSIQLIGRTASKQISKFCNGSIDEFCKVMSDGDAKMFLMIDGFGETMYQSLVDWFDKHWIEFLELKQEFNFITETQQNKMNGINLNGATFCITGKLEHFSNRDALVEDIELHGGKYVSSVTLKTNYLINNDVNSTSSKNTKAKQVGCKIISEQDYLNMIASN